MADGHNPAEMLEAALNGTLELDGSEPQVSEEEAEQTETTEESQAQEPSEKSAEETKPEAKAEQAQATDKEPEGAPIASKSGTYTIPYEKLAEARDEARQYKARAAELEAKVAELTAKQQQNLTAAQEEAQARAQAGEAPTKADQNLQTAQAAMAAGVDASLFGDFSEEGIAKGIATLVEQAKSQIRAEIEKELTPLKEKSAQTEAEAHYAAILGKHADAAEILESAEFSQWKSSLPAFARAGVDHALGKGTAAQVIEVFDAFKAQTKKPAAEEPNAKATAPEVQRYVPNSLSEIASGAKPADAVGQVLSAADSPEKLIEAMMNMTDEQRERVMNRI